MRVIGIDTGPVQSAMAIIATHEEPPVVKACGLFENAELAYELRKQTADRLVVERISPRKRFVKMPARRPKGGGISIVGVGYDVLLACEWAGVFRGSFQARFSGGGLHRVSMIERPDVCRWATGSVADKGAVNEAIAALFEMSKRRAVAKDGPLAGLTDAEHTWDAAAVALCWLFTHGYTVEHSSCRLVPYDAALSGDSSASALRTEEAITKEIE